MVAIGGSNYGGLAGGFCLWFRLYGLFSWINVVVACKVLKIRDDPPIDADETRKARNWFQRRAGLRGEFWLRGSAETSNFAWMG